MLDLEALRAKTNFICDMDGVIYHGNHLIPHVKEFIDWLEVNNKNYLFLTNSSERSPRELAQKLAFVAGGRASMQTLTVASASLSSLCHHIVVVGIGNSSHHSVHLLHPSPFPPSKGRSSWAKIVPLSRALSSEYSSLKCW